MRQSGWNVFRTEMKNLQGAEKVSLKVADLAEIWHTSPEIRRKYKAMATDANNRSKAAAARVGAQRTTRSRKHKVRVSSPLSKDISSALRASHSHSHSHLDSHSHSHLDSHLDSSDSESYCSRGSRSPCSSFVKPSREPFPPAPMPAPYPVPPENMTTEEAAKFYHTFYHGSDEPVCLHGNDFNPDESDSEKSG